LLYASWHVTSLPRLWYLSPIRKRNKNKHTAVKNLMNIKQNLGLKENVRPNRTRRSVFLDHLRSETLRITGTAIVSGVLIQIILNAYFSN